MPEPHERVYRTKKRIMIDNFVGGIAWGLGATIGLAIVFTLLGLILNNIGVVPILGEFILNINEYVLQNQPQLVQ